MRHQLRGLFRHHRILRDRSAKVRQIVIGRVFTSSETRLVFADAMQDAGRYTTFIVVQARYPSILLAFELTTMPEVSLSH